MSKSKPPLSTLSSILSNLSLPLTRRNSHRTKKLAILSSSMVAIDLLFPFNPFPAAAAQSCEPSSLLILLYLLLFRVVNCSKHRLIYNIILPYSKLLQVVSLSRHLLLSGIFKVINFVNFNSVAARDCGGNLSHYHTLLRLPHSIFKQLLDSLYFYVCLWLVCW